MEKPGIFQALWLWDNLLTWTETSLQREKSYISATSLCSKGTASALLTAPWGGWSCWQEEAGRAQEAQKDSDNNIQSFFFFPFHCLFHHISNRRVAHMAHFDSVFLKNPSTLESAIRGACLIPSYLWHWLAGHEQQLRMCALILVTTGFARKHFSVGHNKGKISTHFILMCMSVFQLTREVLMKSSNSVCNPVRKPGGF